MRICGTEERRAQDLAKFGYKMKTNPRFNGEHAAHGYEGIGPDHRDIYNKRGWLLNLSVLKPPERMGRGMRGKKNTE